MNSKPRPYVSVAVICEKVLEEKNGSLSIIRIADQVQVPDQQLPPGVLPAAALQGLIAVKSGDAVGEFTLKVNAINPKGESKEIYSVPFKLLGKDHGQNFILILTLGIENEGVHWFNVLVDDELITRIPLTVVRIPAQTQVATK